LSVSKVTCPVVSRMVTRSTPRVAAMNLLDEGIDRYFGIRGD
jgi:hypothetical protein